MNIYLRRILVMIWALALPLFMAACAEAPGIEIPPLPTYSDETPAPTQTASITPSPVPSAEPSTVPIKYNSPADEAQAEADASPVPTVQSDVPIIEIADATLPDDMVQYNVATLHGHITVDKGNITKVVASLTDSDGNTVQECYFTPGQASFSLAGTVNAQLRFAELQPGDYTYVLTADAENLGINTQKELIHHRFTVYSSEEQMKLAAAERELAYAANITQDSSAAGQIWNFLIVYLDNPYGAAGIMGNIDVESQCNPQRVQGDLSSDFAFSESYTAQVDAGLISKESFVAAIAGEGYGSGYGLCQWSFERKEGLYDLAQERDVSVGDLDTQCIYLVMELEMNYPELLQLLRTTDDAREAAREFFHVYEQGSEMGMRAELAEDYLIKYAS